MWWKVRESLKVRFYSCEQFFLKGELENVCVFFFAFTG